ncbi:uncharacterized protein B0I36DRAFT_363152 [Microdochium trichocladiopsis]|uniref:Lipase B n=1 Tax=Microdochium trichocladiopsis TaxID=1682393 RepID=A0A9P8Y873_9PEZI|nr:uncharacterized protein B0I36DRAFT_363152 [Microdochium trichocladiopsis]KAH7031463.1 hypothetical protein B0I36DRAFT_363152 [Microdochium trichocladiopsis]
MRIAIVPALILGCTAAAAPGLVGGLLGGVTGGLVGGLTGQLKNTIGKIEQQLNDVGVTGSALLAQLGDIQPLSKPSSIQDVVTILTKIGGVKPATLLESTVQLVLSGLGPSNLATVMNQYSAGVNSENNINREPASPVYPAAAGDVPYSITEEKLRGAIYIPSTFTYGKKPPVILVPATGTKGGFTYYNNLGKLLPQQEYADPVWLNVPGWLLEEVPWNSEFVAYAINYISGITSRNVSVVALSQGNLNTQWALTYWPSTRALVSDYIAVSPDYHGSAIIEAMCPSLGLLSCTPSLSQQTYTSNFIQSFRQRSAAAFVPTTTIYTATDEIVQPQHGTGASGYLLQDSSRPAAGVVNVELQKVCPLDSPASLLSDHVSPLWGAALQALIKDALTHDGPADISRIPNWTGECSKLAADGLTLADVVGTTSIGPIAVASWLLYPKRVTTEPAVPAYAL